ncbi:hypothetical protein N7G274_002971 [Stereocaulon virgatum]|uniref:C3H1-type domain-containing protein n=1 Tax=Stereocaulon virgatum TaxID=373712 RepID=A0ABR4AHG3_9LECA
MSLVKHTYDKFCLLVQYLVNVMAPARKEPWTRGTRGGRKGGGASRGGMNETVSQPCRSMQETGQCRFGDECKYSHAMSLSSAGPSSSRGRRERIAETPQQQQAKDEYHAWRRLIKNVPKPNDDRTIGLLWDNALKILNSEHRDWKQMLARDLDSDEYQGRQHIHTLLSMVAGAHGHRTFVDLAHPFLLVITHPALLDCLSVDTYVGGLYNYICGSNGTRAMPFFERLSTSLLENHLESTFQVSNTILDRTLVAMSIALRELLKREPRAMFHEDLPDMVNSLESILEVAGIDRQIAPFQIVRNGIEELRGMIARANGLLQREEKPPMGGVSTSVVVSNYPRDIVLPRDCHDNDKLDITRINILPTEDEIRSDHAPFLPSTDLDQPHFLADPVERHLDTHFRLYRHDCFGEVSEALGAAIIAIEADPGVLEDAKFSPGNIRAYTYPKAHIRNVTFDHRRVGFRSPNILPTTASSQEEVIC